MGFMTQPVEIPVAKLRAGSMPMLGFGTWQLRGNKAREAVRVALETGYRHLDTATMYGNEVQVGQAIRDSGVPRSEVFVTTKLPPERAGRERETLEASLRDLDTDYVDLWLIHWPPPAARLRPTWRAFQALRDEGLVRDIGVSNYSLAQLDDVSADSGEMPSVNQIRWSPSEHDPEVLAGHGERGVVLEGYSGLKGTSLQGPVLTSIAAAHGVSVAQVVLRWHLEHGIVVIPKSSRPERIRSNFDLFGFSLTADEVARIDALTL